MQDWKMADKSARLENAGLKCRTKVQGFLTCLYTAGWRARTGNHGLWESSDKFCQYSVPSRLLLV